ncbi:MAG TPA: quinone-dependent dihydroorotate dehydrogenase, partial [Chitinophagaceae bacterium]
MYRIIRRIFFLFPPEQIHYFSMNCLKLACSIAPLRWLLFQLFRSRNKDLKVRLHHLDFQNPVGLGAGFDKNALYLRELETLGFGFVEIGTVTPLGQPGNPKPRLFRLPADNALINRMGFNNDGAKTIAERLKRWRERPRSQEGSRLLIGGNIGKNKTTPNEEAWKDYATCFNELHPYVDYFVVNVSSPNTPGLRELQEKDALRRILLHLQMINNGKARSKPIMLKIAPDLSKEQIDDVVDLADEIKLDGIVATNTTISREHISEKGAKMAGEPGGLSGAPLRSRSTEILRYITNRNPQIPVIAS